MAENRMHRGRESGVNGLVLGAALAVLVAWPVRADECVSVEKWRTTVIEHSPQLTVGAPEAMSPELLAFIVDRFNNTPPLDKRIEANAGYMLLSRIRPLGVPFGDVLFGFFQNGCLTATFSQPLPHGERPASGEPV
jgi:hypothetical protein